MIESAFLILVEIMTLCSDKNLKFWLELPRDDFNPEKAIYLLPITHYPLTFQEIFNLYIAGSIDSSNSTIWIDFNNQVYPKAVLS